MKKALSEMTLEELWTLFPIILSEPNDKWQNWYQEERQRLSAILCDDTLKIHHIGSTSIHHIWAKPIIDILIEASPDTSFQKIKETLLGSGGYLCMAESENRISFNRGYTVNGFADRVFHLHLRRYDDNDALYFRDYMNACPDLAKEYEQLKLSLWKQYEHQRDAYTDAKTAFVTKYTAEAKQLYGRRYQHGPRAASHNVT